MLGSCSDAVDVSSPALHGAAARTCAALGRALPAHVADQPARHVSSEGAAAAWGDPAITLRCGVGRPAGLDAYSRCETTDGVDWFVPDAQLSGHPSQVTMTTVGRSVYVEVQIPAAYLPPAVAMVDLARAVRRSVPSVRPCQ